MHCHVTPYPIFNHCGVLTETDWKSEIGFIRQSPHVSNQITKLKNEEQKNKLLEDRC